MSDTNKYFKFDFDRKLNPWLKFELNFLTWLPKGKIEKTTVYLLFSLFIQFSAVEIRLVYSHAKLIINSLQRLEIKWSAHARWWAIAILRPTELKMKANSSCFQCARTRGHAKWRHKSRAERMRNANVRNHLNKIFYPFSLWSFKFSILIIYKVLSYANYQFPIVCHHGLQSELTRYNW